MKKLRDTSGQFGPWKFQNQLLFDEEERITKKIKPIVQEKLSLPKMVNPRNLGPNSPTSAQIPNNSVIKKQKKSFQQIIPEALKTKQYSFNPEEITQTRLRNPRSYRKANKKMRENYEELYLSERLDASQLENRERANATKIRLIDRLNFYKNEKSQQQEGDLGQRSVAYRWNSPTEETKQKNKQFAKKRSLIDLVKYLKKESQRYHNESSPPIHQNIRFLSLSEKEIKNAKNSVQSSQQPTSIISLLKFGALKKNLPTFQQKKNRSYRKR